MISSCYVHITLPDKTTPVVAGLFRMENAPTGVIGTFVHAKSYLARSDCVDIDPVELKLGEKPLRTGRMNGIFGALRDSAPDSWGRKVIDHRLGPQGSEINYLLNCPDDRAGALSFGMEKTSPAASNSFNGILDLPVVMRIADELANHDADPSSPKPEGPEAELVERLTRAGTSMGGARPKAPSRTTAPFGWPNSLTGTTNGTIRWWSTPSCGLPENAGLPSRRRKWLRSTARTSCSSSDSIDCDKTTANGFEAG